MRKHFTILLAIVLALLTMSCENPFTKNRASEDQTLVAIQEEFKLNKYDNVLALIDQNSSSFGTNTRSDVLKIKAQALERIVRKLNTDPLNLNNEPYRQEAEKRYKNYNVRLINGKFFYLGRDFLQIARSDPRHAETWYKRYIDLNDPFLDKDLYNTETVQEFGKIISDTLDEMKGKKKELPPRTRVLVLGLIKPELIRLAGINTTISNINRHYVDRMMELCDAMIESSPEKAEIVNSYFIKMSLSKLSPNREILKNISQEMIKKYPNDKVSAFAYYVQGKFAYRSGDARKALAYYNKALLLLAEYSPGHQGFNEMLLYDVADVAHLHQDIINRINIIKAEMDYQERIKTADVAVIAGNTVRLRKSMDSGTQRNIITSLSTGDKVILIKKSQAQENIDGWQDYWYYVQTRNGLQGWIFGKYLIIF